jgi:hypothetical protein
MKDSKVHAISIDEFLSLLRRQEWLIPQFQRDFVWSPSDCAELAQSVLAARPIGMVTVWEQPDDSGLALEPIVLRYGKQEVSFASSEKRPNRFFAVLDGRQRSQATAMAFGGLRATDKRSKFCGRFFLDTTDEELGIKVVFFHQNELSKRGWKKEMDSIADGFFALSSDSEEPEGIVSQWVRYITQITNPDTYPGKKLPPDHVVARRRKVVEAAFDGLSRTRLAVYTVPSAYRLGEICEIFETLNTTGTKVSTVDLIHSWLYAETSDSDEPMLLRAWIGEVGEMTGAIGWATEHDRPELLVQVATACYIAQEKKEPPRKLAGAGKKITSVKAGDLLAVPTKHWTDIREASSSLATFFGDFQRAIGNGSGLFPWKVTPYPVSAGVYVGLRWRLMREGPSVCKWGEMEVGALCRAFFWRNALMGRYDQGFLSQLGTDLRAMIEILDKRKEFGSLDAWRKYADGALDRHLGPMPAREALLQALSDGRTTGAMLKALTLPMRVRVERDLLDPDVSLAFPEVLPELHHIFPRKWCEDNAHGELKAFIEDEADRDPISAVANLMPLGRVSNNQWRTKNPATVIEELNITYADRAATWEAAFVDEKAFQSLKEGANGVLSFWAHRKELILEDLERRMLVWHAEG